MAVHRFRVGVERGRGKANRVKGAKDATVGQSKQTRGNAHFIRSLHFKGTKIYTKLGQIGRIWAENDELPYLAFHEVVDVEIMRVSPGPDTIIGEHLEYATHFFHFTRSQLRNNRSESSFFRPNFGG